MKKQIVMGVLLGAMIFTVTTAMAHSEQAVRDAFDRGPIPQELADATRELESTSGTNSVRAKAHDRQHRLLEQYMKAGQQRRCQESKEALIRLDEAILAARNSATAEEEQHLRQERDDTAAVITETCTETSSSLPSRP